MGDFLGNLYKKVMILVSSILFMLSPFGAPEILKPAEPSTLLTQKEVIKGQLREECELKEFYEISEEDFIIPGLYEGFIPQGIFYSEETELFFISGYYKSKAQPSRVVLVDKDGNFLKSVGAISKKGNKAYGHFGGIAVYKDYIYIATTGVTHVLSLTEVLQAENDEYCLIEKELYTDVTCSFVNVCNGVMYIGEFTENNLEDKKEATNVYYKGLEKFYSRCNAFILDENAPWGIKEDMIDSKGNLTPDFAYAIPLKAQGFGVLNDGRVTVSASATAIDNSNLYFYKDVTERAADKVIKVNEKDVPVYYLLNRDKIKTVKAPTYMEELAVFGEDSVYLITESAAGEYSSLSKNPIDNVIKMDITKIK